MPLSKVNMCNKVLQVMEQQEITLNKAGLHATMRTRVSLLCAMNPAFGKYNEALTLQKNLNLPDSIISR